ncbi:MAG: U32 family peptidase [Clostridium sp.]|uniref:peptidase U32 family protein n=1 Tax=Clostridium sp. TaxID=1506 RepID=UPI0025C2C899|nr:U32 family peptidase [Clostridium sp.]MCE5220385.1 U32 family peptidase [Clostridium sp.]
MIRPEILAPAGNLDKLKIAIDFGADAVYLGGSKLNLRAFADNFTNEQLKEGVEYAHGKNRKVYVTMNVFPHNADLTGVEDYLRDLHTIGVDAIIASDPAIIATAREVVPELEIHLSTQANNVNWKSAKFWYDQGVKRIVMARELNLNEIKQMRDNLPEECEIEAFVHGSMCISYSGRCLLSNYMVGRDANRGACAQPCRYKYSLVEEKRPGEYYPVVEDENGTYIMNSKDLCMIEHIDDVIKAGVYSLKIEGRMKSLYYVAAVVKSYRQAVDAYLKDPDNYKFDPKWMENLNNVSHRQYHTGFYYGETNKQVYEDSGYIRSADIVGIVREYDEETKIATIEQKNKVLNGDIVEVLRPEGDNFEITLHDMTEENGIPIDSAPRAQMMYKVRVDIPLIPKDLLIKNKE